MAKLIIGVDVVGTRAIAGPVTGAAVLFAAETPAPVYEVLGGTQRYTLDDPKKIHPAFLEHIAAHIKKIAISYAHVNCAAEHITVNRDAAWLTMGQAAARAAERAVHTRRADIQVGKGELEIFIPFGGHCAFELVGRVGQRAVASDWRRGAAYLLAKVAHMQTLKILDERFPEYDFQTNLGNASQAHKRAIRKFGKTPEHRKT